MLAHVIPFEPACAADALDALPSTPAVFALGFGEHREPYLARTPNLRRRLRRVLAPDSGQTRRLQLLPFVREISWTPYGSEFEAGLLLYRALRSVFPRDPATVRKRLRLRPPTYLRMSLENDFPRLFATNKYVRSAIDRSFGPFPTRVAAERAADTVLDLFQLRRCVEDLAPFPEHPACPYFEMKKCLAPCNQTATPERHRAEADAVFTALCTHGRSLLEDLDRARTAASEALDFETAAAVHQRYTRVEQSFAEVPDAVHLLAQLSAVLVQPATEPGDVALYRLTPAGLSGPVPYSTLGMRLHNEQSGSSSLYSHPVALAPVPLEPSDAAAPADTLETRLDRALAALDSPAPKLSAPEMEDHLALFTRWCYRPAAKRTGEAVFAAEDGTLPQKPLLRAISRVARAALTREPVPVA